MEGLRTFYQMAEVFFKFKKTCNFKTNKQFAFLYRYKKFRACVLHQ